MRDGRFCAHLLVDHLLAATGHASAVRASIGLSTTTEHVERLLAEIAACARRGDWTAPIDLQTELDAVRPW